MRLIGFYDCSGNLPFGSRVRYCNGVRSINRNNGTASVYSVAPGAASPMPTLQFDHQASRQQSANVGAC